VAPKGQSQCNTTNANMGPEGPENGVTHGPVHVPRRDSHELHVPPEQVALKAKYKTFISGGGAEIELQMANCQST